MQHVFVINPVAGKGNHAAKTRERVLAAAAAQGLEAAVYVTRCAGDGTRFARERAARGDAVRLYACGGDGTLHELLTGAYGYDNVELAAYPIGSGNDYIRNFQDHEAFSDLPRLLAGQPVPVDALRCNELLSLNLANIGFDCDVCRRMLRFKTLPLISGGGAYTLAVAATFLRPFGSRLRVTLDDGRVVDRTMILTVVANGVCYGGGYFATPRARVNDGLLDVCLVEKMTRPQILRLIGLYKAGRHVDSPAFAPYLTYARCRSLTLEAERPLQVCVDGEVLETAAVLRFRVAERPVRFVLPQGVVYRAPAAGTSPAEAAFA